MCGPDVFDELVKRGEAELIGAASLDWLGVPLKAGNTTFGVLVVQSYSGGARFGDKDKEILQFVSQQLASAIENKRNEEALRRSEARYRSLVQSAVYGIYRSSLEGRFFDVNPALITMLGYDSAEEVLALDPKSDVFLDPSEQARVMGEFQRGARLDNVEVRWKRKDGSAITVRLSGRVVNSPEETAEVVEIIAGGPCRDSRPGGPLRSEDQTVTSSPANRTALREEKGPRPAPASQQRHRQSGDRPDPVQPRGQDLRAGQVRCGIPQLVAQLVQPGLQGGGHLQGGGDLQLPGR